MSNNFGESLSLTTDHPWVWVLIPVSIVVILGGVAIVLHSRRRARYRTALSTPPQPGRLDPSGTRALERDLEEAWVRGATSGGTRRPPPLPSTTTLSSTSQPNLLHQRAAGRWTRPSNRWQWAGGVSRPEEGLNELGEAPPPYEKGGHENARRKTGVSAGGAADSGNDDVELRNLAAARPQPSAPIIPASLLQSTTRSSSTAPSTIHSGGEGEQNSSSSSSSSSSRGGGASSPPTEVASQRSNSPSPPPYQPSADAAEQSGAGTGTGTGTDGGGGAAVAPTPPARALLPPP
ncbi:hypothetical protein B0T22DRAFT_208838 [Podospora appendiculata]|uniref:Uncharacterized protein n=1 Tax=Podospora appendiculata TaxID=314037 RepID=A0AAE0X4J4_9PEZI|nr:hypothetical protein B0T22DRAFT_208838 [Podospora appendiculata]